MGINENRKRVQAAKAGIRNGQSASFKLRLVGWQSFRQISPFPILDLEKGNTHSLFHNHIDQLVRYYDFLYYALPVQKFRNFRIGKHSFRQFFPVQTGLDANRSEEHTSEL